jgi:hypothetical protein
MGAVVILVLLVRSSRTGRRLKEKPRALSRLAKLLCDTGVALLLGFEVAEQQGWRQKMNQQDSQEG